LQVINTENSTALFIKQDNALGNIVNISNSTSQVLTILNNGNVGIGITTPLRKLHIVSTNPQLLLESGSAGGGGINFGNTGHGVGRNTGVANFTGGNDVVLYTSGDGHCGLSTAGGSLRVSSNGNVGIGNLVPNYLLSVGNAAVAGSDGKIYIGKNNGSGGSRFFTIKFNNVFDMCFSDSDNKDVLKVNYNAPVNSLVVISNGNVGIGLSNPSQKLTVQGNTLLNGILYVAEATGTVAGANSGSIIIDHENSGGASSIVFRSKVNRGSDFGYIQYQDAVTVNGSGENARLTIGTSNDAEDHIILNPGLGNVGIGTNTPSQRLSVEGSTSINGNMSSTSVNTGVITSGNINATGNITATGTISSGFSDNRLKTFSSAINNPLEIVNKLNGFYYTPNDLALSFGIVDKVKEVGLSAQEVQSVFPEIVKLAPFDTILDSNNNVVSKTGDDYLTIAYERLAPLFVESIKELTRKMDAMAKELEELKKHK